MCETNEKELLTECENNEPTVANPPLRVIHKAVWFDQCRRFGRPQEGNASVHWGGGPETWETGDGAGDLTPPSGGGIGGAARTEGEEGDQSELLDDLRDAAVEGPEPMAPLRAGGPLLQEGGEAGGRPSGPGSKRPSGCLVQIVTCIFALRRFKDGNACVTVARFSWNVLQTECWEAWHHLDLGGLRTTHARTALLNQT